ncbi:ATP-binding cassette domain-containing protein [Phaeobacter piscinae]|uniref:ABC transporter ATP-binding protein/permease n=1 Tax=Phaeobacter piscinae TaxID=1580596 RepID=UPI000C9AFB5A|nr:ABC transporter, ATP binding protein [Phaeobacter piscinae]
MLRLENIVKDYETGEGHFRALNGVNLEFSRGEFVSVVGPSGCGKTTTLNIIGGLDHYSGGDLIIDGKSTKDFAPSDWDAYRCNSVGFVFQNYNLITHLSVQDNVELALVLNGSSKSERATKAAEALKRVGLADQANKKPNLLSGGQQQRVAIARAIVNDPDVILADEPTGALDSKTAVEILDLITEIARDKLVIMVTHSRELAEAYSSRIVEMLDGQISNDTVLRKKAVQASQTTSGMNIGGSAMDHATALKLSFKNIMTKWKRTLAVAAAGSIGICGIALVLSIQNGVSKELDHMQSAMYASMPAISINDGDVIAATDGPGGRRPTRKKRSSDNVVVPFDPASRRVIHQNTLTEEYLAYVQDLDPSLYTDFVISSDLEMNILTQNNGKLAASTSDEAEFTELFDEAQMLTLGRMVHGDFPQDYTEVLLVIDDDGKVNETALSIMGLDTSASEIDFGAITGSTFVIAHNDDFYTGSAADGFAITNDLSASYDSGLPVKVSGIMQLNDPGNPLSGLAHSFPEGIGYLRTLADHVHQNAKDSAIVTAQRAVDYSVLDGFPLTSNDKRELIRKLGGSNIPGSIRIFAADSASSVAIKDHLNAWPETSENAAEIVYTDKAAAVSIKINTMMGGIAMVLGGFAAISLLVSSAMISIITYISTMERTKEIGILRSLGARKVDIARVINAETTLVGLAAGVIGVVFAFLVSIIVNLVAWAHFGMGSISSLPLLHAVLLIGLSVFVTVIAGLFPSRIAANKDPVKALQTD